MSKPRQLLPTSDLRAILPAFAAAVTMTAALGFLAVLIVIAIAVTSGELDILAPLAFLLEFLVAVATAYVAAKLLPASSIDDDTQDRLVLMGGAISGAVLIWLIGLGLAAFSNAMVWPPLGGLTGILGGGFLFGRR